MIDPSTDQLITLNEARALVPAVNGRRVDLSTVYRWVQRGARGVVLESIEVGGRRLTTARAVAAFLEGRAATQPRQTPAAAIATPHQRRRSALLAHSRLTARLGIENHGQGGAGQVA